MLSDADRQGFDSDGYVVVPGVLTGEQVREVRAFLVDLFGRKPVHRGDLQFPAVSGARGGGVRHDIYTRYPELRWMFTHPPIIDALRSLLGEDFVFLPEMVAHDSRYGGWHKDTTPLEAQGETFHWDPGFRMVECGIYLQDNDEHGGGLDVVPGSHRTPDVTPPPPKNTFAHRVRGKLVERGLIKPRPIDDVQREGGMSIPNRAGDLVIFDVRLDHRATQPTSSSLDAVPEDKRKFAIFFVCSSNSEHAPRYRDFLAGQYEHLRAGHSYPPEMTELAERHRLTLG